jgi:hypothetical protein
MKIIFDVMLGLSPIKEINALRDIRDTGDEHALLIGFENIGKYVLTSLIEDWVIVDGRGILKRAEVDMELLEYIGS